MKNEIGLQGIDFVEFTSPAASQLESLFSSLGFAQVMTRPARDMVLFQQNEIRFLVNRRKGSFSENFRILHGPSISSMGWRFLDPHHAFSLAVSRGAKPAIRRDFEFWPAIYGIGGSLIYFIGSSNCNANFEAMGFVNSVSNNSTSNMGLLKIDHLTNNVEQGQMKTWSDFYKDIFGFEEVRYFDIRGAKTGLTSYALRSPCQSFCIPINEGTDRKSQINEYLEEYRGAGVQHIAFLTNDIVRTLENLKQSKIETLDIDDEYYSDVFSRVPNVLESKSKIKEHQILVDGDEKGYLLQIFTKNLVGPIFLEIIQRNNFLSFGEGNFGTLFRSIERDQLRRGYLA